MSVLVKGMEMPKNCYVCEFITFDSGWICKRLKRKIINVEKCNPKDKDCPLVEVPTPHGDLIDRDALNIGEYEREDDDSGTLEISLGGLLSLYHKVIDAPPVIEAEGRND